MQIIMIAAAAAAAVICVILLIFLVVRHRKKMTEEKKYYDAASRMIREICLDEVICSRGRRNPVTKRIMIYIRVKGPDAQGFVFDPGRGIRIGRDPEHNEICIRDNMVSASHCCLYLHQGMPVVQDYNSTNGTWIRRGLHRSRQVPGMSELKSGDRLRVGDTQLQVKFFVFDMMDL